MNALGPFEFNPWISKGSFNADLTKRDIPVLLGRNGFVEIINTSYFDLSVAFQARGNAFQESRSKVIYPVVQDVQGTQMLSLQTPYFWNTIDNGIESILLTQNYFPNLVFINTYEEGEISWYPPVSLARSIQQAQSNFESAAVAAGPYILTLPTTSTVYGVPAQFGQCWLTGFDICIDVATTSTFGTVTITGLAVQPGGSSQLNYRFRSAAATTNGPAQAIPIRFPAPIPNVPGQQITFNVPTFGNANVSLNAFYYLF